MDPDRLDHLPTLKLAMTPFPYAVEGDAPLARAREMMGEHGVHQLPVMAGGKLAGVVTEQDLEGAGEDARVSEVCTLRPYVVEDGEPLDTVLEQMALRHLSAALVVRRGKLVGIFTVTDVCRLFAAWLRARFPRPDGGDDAA